jgi:sporulation integral membrane protein YlbJ
MLKRNRGTADTLLTLLCLAAGLLLLYGSAPLRQGVSQGLRMTVQSLIPSLFPFLVLCSFFTGSGAYLALSKPLGPLAKLFRLPVCTAGVILLSLVGGYPAGAKMVRNLMEQGRLSRQQGEAMLCFCFGSGPAFAIGVVGTGVFGSTQAGIVLFAAHTAASLFTGLLFTRRLPTASIGQAAEAETKLAPTAAFVEAVSGSVTAMLSIGGFVMLFCGLIALLDSLSLFALLDNLCGSWASTLLPGLLEVTGGCLGQQRPGVGGLLLCSFFLSFGGLCVHAQIYGLLGKHAPSYARFLLSRLVCGGLSTAIVSFSLRFVPLSLPASLPAGEPVVSLFSVSPLSALFFFFLVWSFVYQMEGKFPLRRR